MQVLWFKRHLRIKDHRALARAAQLGPTLPIHVVEPWTFVASNHVIGQRYPVRIFDHLVAAKAARESVSA